jgi:hypothetical protein
MQSADNLAPPIQYSLIWLVVGTLMLMLVAGWIGFVLWSTRAKKIKLIDDLKPLSAPDLDLLKAKYLQLIDELNRRYLAQELSLRKLHQELSKTVREFIHEGHYYPAPFLALYEMKQLPYQSLGRLIAAYYPEEFAAMTKGDATAAVHAAREVVIQWPS